MRLVEDIVQSCLMSYDELGSLLGWGDVAVLDASLPKPGSDERPYETYLEKRIPGAQYFDVNACADLETDLPHMMPSPEVFAHYAAERGIGKDTLVVIYGQKNLAMGPARVWWMFRAFGHERVCVLNGSLEQWAAQGTAIETGEPQVPRMPQDVIEPVLNPKWVTDKVRVQKAAAAEEIIIDARSVGRFKGIDPEPRAGLAKGHIAGSLNLPHTVLWDSASHELHSRDEILSKFSAIGVDKYAPVIATCGSGVTACVLALALVHCGANTVQVYDGSWAEWGRLDA